MVLLKMDRKVVVSTRRLYSGAWDAKGVLSTKSDNDSSFSVGSTTEVSSSSDDDFFWPDAAAIGVSELGIEAVAKVNNVKCVVKAHKHFFQPIIIVFFRFYEKKGDQQLAKCTNKANIK